MDHAPITLIIWNKNTGDTIKTYYLWSKYELDRIKSSIKLEINQAIEIIKNN